MFSMQREIIITSFFRKLTKISTNNFKTDINGIYVRNVQKYYFCINPFLSTNQKFYHMLSERWPFRSWDENFPKIPKNHPDTLKAF